MAGLVGIRAARGAINQGEEKGREKGGKVLKRWWWFVDEKKKKDDHRKPFFEPIYASSISTQNLLSLFVPNQRGSKFNNSRHANPRYEETLLGNLLSVHACRYILFTVYSPLPSVPPHRLIYGFPSRYSSPSCSSRALRLFLRVYPDLARASFTLFRPRREKLRPR